jgi:hypothetical protein
VIIVYFWWNRNKQQVDQGDKEEYSSFKRRKTVMAKDAAVGAWQCEEKQKDLPVAHTCSQIKRWSEKKSKRETQNGRGVGVFVKFYLAKFSYFPFLPFLLACLEAYSPQPPIRLFSSFFSLA